MKMPQSGVFGKETDVLPLVFELIATLPVADRQYNNKNGGAVKGAFAYLGFFIRNGGVYRRRLSGSDQLKSL